MLSNRRDFLRTTAIGLAALPVVLPRFAYAQSESAPMQLKERTMRATADASIQPFSVNIPEDAVADLRKRIAGTRLPDKEPAADRSQGVQLAMLQNLMAYWGTDYDFGRLEARLNGLPQFMTQIDGLDIHFIHVRSKHDNAMPLILTHGWPGSIVEMLDVVGPLSDPTAFGGSADDAFDVVIPSMPGYGFSGEPTTSGWHAGRIAQAWAELMGRLGYTATLHRVGTRAPALPTRCRSWRPPGCSGVHFNFLVSFPPEVTAAVFGGRPSGAGWDVRRGTNSVEGGRSSIHARLYRRAGPDATDNRLLVDRFARWPCRVDADHDADSYGKIAHAFVDGRPTGGLTRDRNPRQHHPLLADEYWHLRSAVVLGVRTP